VKTALILIRSPPESTIPYGDVVRLNRTGYMLSGTFETSKERGRVGQPDTNVFSRRSAKSKTELRKDPPH
jgi:hypothetical protein